MVSLSALWEKTLITIYGTMSMFIFCAKHWTSHRIALKTSRQVVWGISVGHVFWQCACEMAENELNLKFTVMSGFKYRFFRINILGNDDNFRARIFYKYLRKFISISFRHQFIFTIFFSKTSSTCNIKIFEPTYIQDICSFVSICYWK